MNIKVKGGQVLSGEITPSGNKNSAVSLIPSTILFDHMVVLENIPDILDVVRLISIMEKLGSRIHWDKEEMRLEMNNSKLRYENLDKDDLGNMKGTSLLWGSMLARFKKITFKDLPGGCTLGFRTLDAHFQAFKDLGVFVSETNGGITMDASKALAGCVWLTEMSVSATENVIMLASGLTGTTTIMGAASEPHVQDLCRFLVSSGIQIGGIGSSVIRVTGGYPKTVTHRLLSDHTEITTFLTFSAATGGKVKIKDVNREFLKPMEQVFSKFGVDLIYQDGTVNIEPKEIKIIPEEKRGNLIVRAQPWPFLPVDTLPLFIPLSLAAKDGQVIFHNWMYESGLFWTSELTKLGANIIMADPHRVIVNAGQRLHGAELEAPYIIRAVVAMVIAAMISEGETIILNADALYRGHPKFAENLRKLGADIEEI